MPVVRRSVLEHIDVPIPTLDIQKRIAELNALMRDEQELLKKLAEKRIDLIMGACLKAVREN